MELGAEVWYKDKNDGWCPATIAKKEETTGQLKYVVQVKKGKTKEEFTVVAPKETEIDSLKLMNTAEDSEVENLINLPFLHEPAILFCLELRYNRSQIYTYTGPILIAVNPFKKVDLYGDKLLETYFKYGIRKSQGIVETPLAPHPFAIADAAYRYMMTAIMNNFGGPGIVADQSILISGESGAGKTESTKIVLRYLTTVASETRDVKTEGSIMDKVLKSNPILEALGNAKTIRNDNSSRFGKFIELKFDNNGHLIGGFIRTYLLEKVRLTSQQLNERNFHIFYQMGVGGNFFEKERWGLTSLREFYYVNQGQCFGIERINDEVDYADLRHALKTLRFDEDDVKGLFDIIAGLLHLGQLRFIPIQLMGEEGSAISTDADITSSLATSMKLLGIGSPEFLKTVTERTIVARNDKYQKKLTSPQASDARDSISRIVYGKLFNWVVATINKEIKTSASFSIRSEIAVLDIFGFECLTENSFEQLCINYTNETLQQQFNQFIFKLEQAEYEEEGIEWSFVEFPDNQDCLDLIESKKKSIFRLLDDECMLAGGTDVKFASRMITELAEYDRLTIPEKLKVIQKFGIKHYAGEVVYSALSFVDKNKDELPKESIELMASSSLPLLKLIFTTDFGLSATEVVPTTKANSLTSPTICTQFKAQLGSLMAKIQSTTPHYIRCIKPNDQNKPDLLNRVRTTEQLRYGGVLEAVRVARSGFPVRFSHEEFYARYRTIANAFSPIAAKMPRYLKCAKSEEGNQCIILLDFIRDTSIPKLAGTEKNFLKLARKAKEAEYVRGAPTNLDLVTSIQLGKSKVFFRKQAHDLFEARRSKRTIISARRMQSSIRRWLARVKYLRTLKAAFRLQIAIRYFLFHTKFLRRRRLNAAVRIQSAFRSHSCSKKFKKFAFAVLSSQTIYRGKLARKRVLSLRYMKYAVTVQRLIRGLMMRFKYRKFLKAVCKLQGRIRIKRAKHELKDLKIAAKDVSSLKKSNEQMKAEMEKLREAVALAQAAADNKKAMAAEKLEMEAKAKKEKEELEIVLRQEAEEKRVRDIEEAKKLEAEHLKALEDALKEKENEAQAAAAKALLDSVVLKEKVEILEREKEEALVKSKELEAEKAMLNQELAAKVEVVSLMESKLVVLESELTEEKHKVMSEQANIAALREEFVLREAQIKEMELAAAVAVESAASKEKIAALEEESAVLEIEVKALKGVVIAAETKSIELATALVQKEEEVALLRASSDVMESKVATLEAAVAQDKAQLVDLQLKIESSTLASSEAEAKIQALDIERSELQASVHRLEESVYALEEKLEDSSSNDIAKQAQLEELDVKVSELQAALEVSETLIVNGAQAVTEANAKVEALESRTVEQATKLKAQAEKLKELESELGVKDYERSVLGAGLESEKNVMAVQQKELETTCATLDHALHVKTEENKNLESTVQELAVQLNELELIRVEKEEAIQTLQSKVEQLESSGGSHQVQMKELDAALASAIAANAAISLEHKQILSKKDELTEKVLLADKELHEMKEVLHEAQVNNKHLIKSKEDLEARVREQESRIKDLDEQNKLKDDTLSSTVRYLHKQTFNSRTEDFKAKMTQGFVCKVYAIAFPPTDCVIALSKNPMSLFFSTLAAPASNGFSIFPSRLSLSTQDSKRFSTAKVNTALMSPINVVDICDLQAGLSTVSEAIFSNLVTERIVVERALTISYTPNMVVVLVLDSLESRNFVLNGLKVLIPEVQLELDNPASSGASAMSAVPVSLDSSMDFKQKYERLMTQVLSLTNDVMDREEQLIVMRNRSKAHLDEDRLRAELSHRLEELLIEKQDLLEEMREK